jgi:hypothetical protein
LSEQPSGGENNHKFQAIEDKAEADRLFKEALKGTAIATIWTKNNQHVFKSKLNTYTEVEVFYVKIPKSLDPNALKTDLAKSDSSDCFFNVALTKAHIFFKSAFIGFDSSGLKFKLPDKLFKVQRRNHMRYSFMEHYLPKVQFKDPREPVRFLTKKMLDISGGGLAIQVNSEEATIFLPGLILNNLTFSLRERVISCDAEVRHVTMLPAFSPLRGKKVGLLFQNLKTYDLDHINNYVLEENRKSFTKMF